MTGNPLPTKGEKKNTKNQINGVGMLYQFDCKVFRTPTQDSELFKNEILNDVPFFYHLDQILDLFVKLQAKLGVLTALPSCSCTAPAISILVNLKAYVKVVLPAVQSASLQPMDLICLKAMLTISIILLGVVDVELQAVASAIGPILQDACRSVFVIAAISVATSATNTLLVAVATTHLGLVRTLQFCSIFI